MKLSWNTKNFEPLSPEVLAALKKLEDSPKCQKPLEGKSKNVKNPSWNATEQMVKRIESSHSTSKSCQTSAHPVSPNARKPLELSGKCSCKIVLLQCAMLLCNTPVLPPPNPCCTGMCLLSMVGFFWHVPQLESQSDLFVCFSSLSFIHL